VCSLTDGETVADPLGIEGGHYRVRFDGKWIDRCQDDGLDHRAESSRSNDGLADAAMKVMPSKIRGFMRAA